MLSEIRAANYKSYGPLSDLPLRKLTVFLGKNNSGKTAAIRIPLLLSAGFALKDAQTRTLLPLHVRGLRFGASLLDLVKGNNPHGTMALGLSFVTAESAAVDVDVSIQIFQSLESGVSGFVSSFDSNRLAERIDWVPGSSSESAISYSHDVKVFDGLLPHFEDDRAHIAADLRSHFENTYSGLLHLTAMRSPISAVYERRSSTHEPAPTGSEVPFLLNESPSLLDEVSAWYAQNMDVLGVDLSAEAAAFQLTLMTENGSSQNLAQVGQGIQQVLPVIAYLCALQNESSGVRTLVIEEPELHLHPAAHGAVADQIVKAVTTSSKAQVLIETHSENLLLRLRRHVATGRLSPEDVNLIYFENVGGETRATEITIGPDGAVSSWPKGVFSEDLEEVRQISRAARR